MIKNFLMSKKSLNLVLSFIFLSIYFISCSKEPTTPQDACAGKILSVTGTVTPTAGGTTSNGSITAVGAGGSGFTYSINNGPFQASGDFTNLSAASYNITAKDNAGCTVSKSFTVTATACPVITITATTTNASSATATDGKIVAAATGSTGITYSLNTGPFQATGTFLNLAAGSYTVNAKDANGCTAANTFLVASATCPVINVNVTTVASSGPTATNGSITATATGGLAPFTYSKDGTTFQATGSFTNLQAGNYTIIAKDANGCLGTSGTVVLASAACPTFSVASSVTASDFCLNNNGTITVTATGGTGFTYNINSGTFQASNIFNSLSAGNYTIGVKDLNGCQSTASVAIIAAPAGPKFSLVKAMMATNCALSGCHAGPSPQNGLNFTDDCTIAAQSLRIKARAVDANPSVMPPTGALPASEKQKIIDWVNAGGLRSN
jgi:hypothetical protein